MTTNTPRRTRRSQSWEGVADWYAGWAGPKGSRYHRTLAVPLLLDLLQPGAGEALIDLGCGPGVLAPPVAATGMAYTGLDLSPSLISIARRHNGRAGRFVVGDATRAAAVPGLRQGTFDAASFLLSIQDIDPLTEALASAARLVHGSGRVVIVMLHPCFRVPRQSGWGWDEGRKLRYRRVDSYLSDLEVPMQPHHSGKGVTRSYHRPLGAYIAALSSHGFAVTALREVRDIEKSGAPPAERRAAGEIPMLLGLRADRLRSG
ncbi:class I SAM-dependent methyltransferase [Pelagibacterium xiamenense]|uniref:class I SAM-dependent methyltransferase n=1 Tax=Pelagibacterium xiamenense TaxID=2901140 RepID=UPI001E3F1DA3|nr:class I SAM-dependent methyltransferase [Pelagibacterium xiamenense]MCD7059259.1 class I SAM-dependent methyltransferase [Pelagibacterium xiamenense]